MLNKKVYTLQRQELRKIRYNELLKYSKKDLLNKLSLSSMVHCMSEKDPKSEIIYAIISDERI